MPRTADPLVDGTGGAAASRPGPRATPGEAARTTDVAIIGGGCSGLALALELRERSPKTRVLVLEGRSRPDPRVWGSWDDGSEPVPEARSASWSRWEIRTRDGVSTGVDEEHPYRLVRSEDRRAAIGRRLASSAVTVLDGAAVHDVSPHGGERLLLRTSVGPVDAGRVVDATGETSTPTDPPAGRVLLHQRFLGLWVRTAAPVFDGSTVTLMDFTGDAPTGAGDAVSFVYVLPISPTEALIESTVFSRSRRAPLGHRAHIADHLRRRWDLGPRDFEVTGSESGSIPMTDAPARTGRPGAAVISGLIRPSSGYGYARAHRHAPVVAGHVLAGTAVPAFRDRARTRALDAVFLRFLRDRPDAAPEAFRRLFTLPGPLVVRFLTERSTLRDDLRVVLALPPAPFVAAALRTVRERLAAVARGRRRP